jgi:hypothetical protein
MFDWRRFISGVYGFSILYHVVVSVSLDIVPVVNRHLIEFAYSNHLNDRQINFFVIAIIFVPIQDIC